MSWNAILAALLHTVFFVSLVGSAALVAIWAGLSRRHRLLRLAVFCLFPAAMYFAEAPELVILLSLEMAATTGSLIVYRLVDDAPWGRTFAGLPKIRFGFRDLFFAIFLVALAVWGIMLPPMEKFAHLLIVAGLVELLGIVTIALAAAWAALGKRRLGVRLSVLVGTTGLTTAVWYYWWGDRAVVALLTGQVLDFAAWRRGVLPGVTAIILTAHLVAARGWVATSTCTVRRSAFRRSCSLVVLIGLTLLMAIPGGYLYYELVRPISLPTREAPSPNGYTQLVAIAKQIDESRLWAKGTPTQAQWQAFEKRHRHLLRQARQALDLPSLVPLDPSEGWGDAAQALRSLARSLDSQAGLPIMQGNGDEASAIYFDLVRLADRAERGGVLLDRLLGVAIEGIGIAGITKVVPDLSVRRSRELIKNLHTFDGARESLDDVVVRDVAFTRLAHGWAARWDYAVYELILGQPSYLPAVIGAEKRRRASLAVLLADLAIHVYRHDHGRPPDKLADLVGEYLPAVSIDAFDGKPVRYRKTKTQYLLYSIGMNRQDDGGKANVQTGDWPVVKRPLDKKQAGGGP